MINFFLGGGDGPLSMHEQGMSHIVIRMNVTVAKVKEWYYYHYHFVIATSHSFSKLRTWHIEVIAFFHLYHPCMDGASYNIYTTKRIECRAIGFRCWRRLKVTRIFIKTHYVPFISNNCHYWLYIKGTKSAIFYRKFLIFTENCWEMLILIILLLLLIIAIGSDTYWYLCPLRR